MMDKLKTFLLAALILTSLFQTYTLIYSTPKFEPIAQGTDYVKTEALGEKKEASELLFPDYMVFHL
jgi:regulatory protein YycH of two-component signal transduction system YycFG